MTNPKRIADAYLAIWNNPDPGHRRKLIADGWATGASYVDPLMAGDGHEGIATMIDAAREQFPGHAFSLLGVPDGHGDHVRFSWTLAPADGAVVAGGTDIVTLDGSGRIARVIGFLDGGAA